jgi:hypothetical protein
LTQPYFETGFFTKSLFATYLILAAGTGLLVALFIGMRQKGAKSRLSSLVLQSKLGFMNEDLRHLLIFILVGAMLAALGFIILFFVLKD